MALLSHLPCLPSIGLHGGRRERRVGGEVDGCLASTAVFKVDLAFTQKKTHYEHVLVYFAFLCICALLTLPTATYKLYVLVMRVNCIHIICRFPPTQGNYFSNFRLLHHNLMSFTWIINLLFIDIHYCIY